MEFGLIVVGVIFIIIGASIILSFCFTFDFKCKDDSMIEITRLILGIMALLLGLAFCFGLF